LLPPAGSSRSRKYKLVIRRTYQQTFQRAAARAGLPPQFIPHSLRHLYASIALAEGIPITEVSRWLGHNSIEVTHQIYGHLIPTSLDRAPHHPRHRVAQKPSLATPERPRRPSDAPGAWMMTGTALSTDRVLLPAFPVPADG